MYQAERGLFELRRDRRILLREKDGRRVLVAGVDGLGPDALRELVAAGEPLRLILTPHRAAVLGLGLVEGAAGAAAGGGAVSVLLPHSRTLEEVVELASSVLERIPDLADLRLAGPGEAAGLALARLARLLPAVVAVPADPARVPLLAERLASGALLEIPVEEVEALEATGPEDAVFVSEAPVPLASNEDARFLLFRESRGLVEHVAVCIGDPAGWERPVPVRLHSACLTGDLFSSLKCDCGEQLRRSIAHFAEHGGGVLLYLAHEGRSIGLGNKLRTYSLQGCGLDTVDSDAVLGFGPDERDYRAAVAMLRHLGVDEIRLLTNNPAKMEAVTRAGIRVAERVGLHGTLNRFNLPYVEAKVHRAGHFLEGMLAQKLRDA